MIPKIDLQIQHFLAFDRFRWLTYDNLNHHQSPAILKLLHTPSIPFHAFEYIHSM